MSDPQPYLISACPREQLQSQASEEKAYKQKELNDFANIFITAKSWGLCVGNGF